jgi:hypothetical protein
MARASVFSGLEPKLRLSALTLGTEGGGGQVRVFGGSGYYWVTVLAGHRDGVTGFRMVKLYKQYIVLTT